MHPLPHDARRLLLACVCFAGLTACQSGGLTSGNATLALSSDGQQLTFKRGNQTLLSFGTDGFELGTVGSLTQGSPSFDPYWLNQPNAFIPAGLQWVQLPANGKMKLVSLSSTQMKVEVPYSNATATVTFTAGAKNRIDALMEATIDGNRQIGFMRLRPNASASDGFYGLGEWGDTVDHRGQYRPMQMEANLSYEGSDNEDHCPIPLLVGTSGWGLFVESKRPGAFDVATQNATVVEITYGTAEQSNLGLAFHLISEPEPLDVIKHYYDLTGYPKLPAQWALGPLLWRNSTMSESEVMSDISTIRSLPVATSGIWFDDPYQTGVDTFDYNPATFPDMAGMVSALHDAGLRFGGWHVPYEAPATASDPSPTLNSYALQNHYFPPTTGILVNHWDSPPIDFTNPAAVTWWQSELMNLTSLGQEGFKLDYGEDIENGIDGVRDPWLFSDGSDERTMHYGFTLLYHETYADVLPSTGGFLLCRTARWGDQIHGSIIWPGDLDASFNNMGDMLPGGALAVGGLPAALMKGISLAASGFAFYASDTGGYRNVPSPPDIELWMRWVEANSVQSAMEVGNSASIQPWEIAATATSPYYASQILADYQTYASLHIRLFPYEWTYAQNLANGGRPIVRPFGLAYPAMGQNPNDQYMFGDVILSAPVVTAAATTGASTTRSVIIPPGTWIGWWDGQPIDGGAAGTTIQLSVNLDTLPLYIEQGGIVPMLRPNIDTLAPVPSGSTVQSYASDPGVLWVRIAPGPTKTSFTLYDGTAISQQQSGSTITLSSGSSSVFTQGAVFEVIATAMPSSVRVGGSTLNQQSSLDALESAANGWAWTSDTGGTLWIKTGSGTVTVTE